MTGRRLGRIAFVLAMAAVFVCTYFTPLGDGLTIEALRESHHQLAAAVHAQPLWWEAAFFLACIAATALCFPAGPIIGISAGALFGFWPALAIVATASPIGSTLAALTARYVFRDSIRARFARPLARIDRGINTRGGLYLLALRLNPFVPYWLVNLAAGVTRMRLSVYVPVTVLGLFPALLLYVTAGSQLARLESVGDAFPPEVLIVLLILSLVPLLAARSEAAAPIRSA